MPNAIKYNVSAETLALKKGNFYIGTGDVGKGPTSSTGYYNGITPPSGGYTIYLNKATGGPSIYTVTTEAQMVSLTNSIGSQSFTTSGQCLNWFATQTDKMIFNRDYEPIVTNGLVLNLDAGFTPSYPTTNTTWYDVSSAGNNGTLINGPTYNSANGGSIVFDGVDDYVNCGAVSVSNNNLSINIWCKPNSTQVTYADIIDFDHSNGGWVIQQNVNSLNNYQFAYYNSVISDFYATSIFSLTQNVWQNLTVVKNEGNVIVYINNSISTNNNFPNSGVGGSKILRICNWVNNNRNWNGNISITQIYNRALTSTEVAQNYNAQKGRFGL